jgi:hypothetical protein
MIQAHGWNLANNEGVITSLGTSELDDGIASLLCVLRMLVLWYEARNTRSCRATPAMSNDRYPAKSNYA